MDYGSESLFDRRSFFVLLGDGDNNVIAFFLHLHLCGVNRAWQCHELLVFAKHFCLRSGRGIRARCGRFAPGGFLCAGIHGEDAILDIDLHMAEVAIREVERRDVIIAAVLDRGGRVEFRAIEKPVIDGVDALHAVVEQVVHLLLDVLHAARHLILPILGVIRRARRAAFGSSGGGVSRSSGRLVFRSGGICSQASEPGKAQSHGDETAAPDTAMVFAMICLHVNIRLARYRALPGSRSSERALSDMSAND